MLDKKVDIHGRAEKGGYRQRCYNLRNHASAYASAVLPRSGNCANFAFS